MRSMVAALMAVWTTSSVADFHVGPYLQKLTSHQVTIRWEARLSAAPPTLGIKKSGLSDYHWFQAARLSRHHRSMRPTHIHTVTVNDLTPATRYTYAIDGHTYEFQTPPARGNTDPFWFAVYSDSQKRPDIHQTIITQARRLGHESLEGQPAYVLLPGDMVHDGSDYDEYRVKFFQPTSSVTPSLPYYPAIGNHEYQGLGQGESPIYFNYFSFPDNESSSHQGHWYRIDYGNTVMLSINTNLGATTRYRFHPDMYDEQAAAAQMVWLRSQLDEICNDSLVDFVFAQFHHPGASELWAVGAEAYAQEIIDLLGYHTERCRKAGIVFNGHTHAYARGQDRYGPLYVATVASAGGSLDQWGDFPNKDVDDIVKSIPGYGVMLVQVNQGSSPNFLAKRFGLDGQGLREEDSFGYDTSELLPEKPETLLESITDGFLRASAFRGEAAHIASRWEIYSRAAGHVKRVFNKWIRAENWFKGRNQNEGISLEEIRIPDTLGAYDGPYLWRVKYRSAGLRWSPWSDLRPLMISDRP